MKGSVLPTGSPPAPMCLMIALSSEGRAPFEDFHLLPEELVGLGSEVCT